MSTEDHKQALSPNFRLGAYRVTRVLGVGGFGVTYLCEHTGLGVQVAMKEYLPNEIAVRYRMEVHPKSAGDREGFEWGLSRFLDEARTLAQFEHRNVVRVRDCFEANNTAYIVMDYEDGEPLDALLRRHGTLTEAQLKRVLLPVADGLRQVHAAGFLHRDIKPANIFVRRSDESPVLLDFGSARQALGRRSRSMTAVASAGYSPPEQYERDGPQGAWTDIYALSALCYRAITGEPPIEATRRQSQLLRTQTDPLPRLAETPVSTCSPAFLEAVDWGLRPIETERPQSLDHWLAWLEQSTTHRGGEYKPKLKVEGETTAAATPLKWETETRVREFDDSVIVDATLKRDAHTYISISCKANEYLRIYVSLRERLRGPVSEEVAVRFGDEAIETIPVKISQIRSQHSSPPFHVSTNIIGLDSDESFHKETGEDNCLLLARKLTQHSKFRFRHIGGSSSLDTARRIDLTFEYDKDSAKKAISKVFEHFGYELARTKWTLETHMGDSGALEGVGAILWKDADTSIVVSCNIRKRLHVLICQSKHIEHIWPLYSEEVTVKLGDEKPETIYMMTSEEGTFSLSDDEKFNTVFENHDAVELARRLTKYGEFVLRYQGVDLTFEYDKESATVSIGTVLEYCGYEL